jgi:hypothetical protein
MVAFRRRPRRVARADENKPPKRQLASLLAKVQVYEKVIRNISLSSGLTDEQVINGAMTIVCIAFIGSPFGILLFVCLSLSFLCQFLTMTVFLSSARAQALESHIILISQRLFHEAGSLLVGLDLSKTFRGHWWPLWARRIVWRKTSTEMKLREPRGSSAGAPRSGGCND